MNFSATKPDVRIMLIQIILTSILVFKIKSIYVLVLFFIMIDSLNLLKRDYRTFANELMTYLVIFALTYISMHLDLYILDLIITPFLFMALKIAPSFCLIKFFIKNVNMSEALYVLDKMHLSKSISIPILIIYRYIPTILMELTHINESLKLRNLIDFKHPIRTIENYLSPLFMRSEKLSDELTAAALCKALTVNNQRTCINDVKLNNYDFIYILVMSLMMILIFYLDGLMR